MILSTLRTLTTRQWAGLIGTAVCTGGTVAGAMILLTNLAFLIPELMETFR